jgi:hypothetical protein
MAVPSWLRVSLTIADFLFQRVDKVGPVQLESSADQPPEQAQELMDAPELDIGAGPADVDAPNSADSSGSSSSGSFGFQAARAGGGGTPSGGGGEPPENDDDDDDDDNGDPSENAVRCSFRSLRPSDQPTRYEVERDRDESGEGPA